MLRTKKAPKSRWILITVVFLGIIVLLITGVILVRLMGVFSRSHFDGHHELIVEFIKSPNTAAVVAFSPDTHAASLLWIDASKVDNSYLKKQLQLPFDATVISDSKATSLKQLVSDLFFHHEKSHTSLTLVDAFNLLVFAYTLSPSAISQEVINLSGENVSTSKQGINSGRVGQLFIDHTLYNGASSVIVINATGISGVGNNVAKVLTNVGANVIAVNTSNNIESISKITYVGKKQYSQIRISEILGIPLTTFPTPLLSDITVIIGKD